MNKNSSDGATVIRLIITKTFLTLVKLFGLIVGGILVSSLLFALTVPVFISVCVTGGSVIVVGYLFLRVMRSVYIRSMVTQTTTLQQVKGEIAKYFLEPKKNGEPLFSVTETDKSVEIGWAQSIAYNQLINLGAEGAHIKVIALFDDSKKQVRIRTKEFRVSGRLGIPGLATNFSYRSGFWVTYSSTFVPSFVITDGKPEFKIETLSINSMNLTAPIVQFALENGWSVRLG